MINNTREIIEYLYQAGYRGLEDGTISSPYKSDPIIGSKGRDGYLKLVGPRPRRHKLQWHRFIAYCKFGDDIFTRGVVVRHLNGDKLDNSFNNLALGSHKDNALDKPEDQRVFYASMAARKYTHLLPEIFRLLADGNSHASIRRKFSMPKSSFSYIANKKCYNVKGVDY